MSVASLKLCIARWRGLLCFELLISGSDTKMRDLLEVIVKSSDF